MSPKSTALHFIKNLQGDVIRVYRVSDKAIVATYSYDSWGNITSATGEVAEENPFRYRGYYYDSETGFYYVSSRYYDSKIGRFINADTTEVLTIDLSSLKEKNLYSYCNNNPVMYKDVTGTIADTALDIVFIAGDIASIIANPTNVVGYVELAADIVGLAVPGLTGGGKIVRAVINSSDLLKASKVADRIVDSQKAIKATRDIGKAKHSAYNPINRVITSAKDAIVNRAIKNTRYRPDAVDFTNRIIYELKPYNKRSYKKALRQTSRYADILGGEWKIVIDMYTR